MLVKVSTPNLQIEAHIPISQYPLVTAVKLKKKKKKNTLFYTLT
jgi:hypothetical protein